MNKLFAITIGMLTIASALNAAVDLQVTYGEESGTLSLCVGQRYLLLGGGTEQGEMVAIHAELLEEMETGAKIRFYTLTGTVGSEEVNQEAGDCDFTFGDEIVQIDFENSVTPLCLYFSLSRSAEIAMDRQVEESVKECPEVCKACEIPIYPQN